MDVEVRWQLIALLKIVAKIRPISSVNIYCLIFRKTGRFNISRINGRKIKKEGRRTHQKEERPLHPAELGEEEVLPENRRSFLFSRLQDW